MGIRRINLLGGSGIGKSTHAAWLFSQLKNEGFLVELVREKAKSWAWENRPIRGWDEWQIFIEQLLEEERLLRSNPDLIIISDSPLWLNAFYMDLHNAPCGYHAASMCSVIDHEYGALNLLLNRGDRKFIERGRYESEEEARIIDADLYRWLGDEMVEIHPILSGNFSMMLGFVREQIEIQA